MSATSKSLEEKIDEEVKKRVRLKLRLWTKFIYSALDRWEEICDDGDVLPGEGQSESRSDPAAAQLEEDNTETDDSAAGTECTERDMEETLTKFMTSPNDVNVEDAEEDDDGDSNVEESDDIDRSYNFDTLRSSSPNRTEECGDIAEDEYRIPQVAESPICCIKFLLQEMWRRMGIMKWRMNTKLVE